MTRGQIAVINAAKTIHQRHNSGKRPFTQYHGWYCSRCQEFAWTLTHSHAERCGFGTVAEMKTSEDVIEIGGRKK